MTRVVSLAAVMFAVLAPVLFVLIFFFGSIGLTAAGPAFSPYAIAATALGVIASVWAIVLRRTRTLGITTALVMLPCVFLAFLSIVSLNSR